jgi:hypothetical protein
VVCPKCKKNEAHRAERVSFADNAANRFYLKPYACGACRHRFYALRRDINWPTLREEAARRWVEFRRGRPGRRKNREWLLYFLVGLAIFGAIWLLVQQRS